MSCNYYIETRDVDMVFDLGERVIPIPEKRIFECHLCQTFGTQKPLFESHSYKTFEELKKILLNKSYEFKIVDEYGVEITPENFIEYMEKDNKEGSVRFGMPIDEYGFQFYDKDFC